MSVEVPLNIFSFSEKQELLKQLTVIAQQKEGKKDEYKKDVTLYTFDIISKNGNEYILLPFSYCHNFLASKLIKHNLCLKYPNDHIKYPKCKPFEFPDKLRKNQKNIEKDVIEILNRTHSIVIAPYTGFGKTFFALYLCFKMKYQVAISVNRIKLIDQWIKSIKKRCPGATYQVIESKIEIDKDANFYIFNMTNISKRDMNEFSHVGVLICDEVHTLCTPSNSQTLFYFQPKYLIALSATPYRTDKLSDLVHLYFGIEIIYEELYRPFNVYCCYTDFVPKIKSKNGLEWNKVIESICMEDTIIELVINIARFFITRNILILTKRVEIEGKLYYDKLKSYNENVDIFTGKKNHFDENCRILIATCSKAGVGFDLEKLDMLIVASDMEENFIQYLGRVFRKEDHFPIIVDIVHGKFFPLYNHFKTRKMIYEKSGGEIKNIFTCFPELWKFIDYYKPINIY